MATRNTNESQTQSQSVNEERKGFKDKDIKIETSAMLGNGGINLPPININ